MLYKTRKLVFSEITSLFRTAINAYPDTVIGNRLRYLYWRKKLKNCGVGVGFRRNSVLGIPERIEIGDRSVIGEYCMISAAASHGVYIGCDCMISRNVNIHSGNHRISDLEMPMNAQGYDCREVLYVGQKYSVVIEDDVWIGSSCVLISGTHIGPHSVICAGTVVSGTIAPYSIVAGNPGRIIGNRQKRFGIQKD